jgi:hypothetical protein
MSLSVIVTIDGEDRLSIRGTPPGHGGSWASLRIIDDIEDVPVEGPLFQGPPERLRELVRLMSNALDAMKLPDPARSNGDYVGKVPQL